MKKVSLSVRWEDTVVPLVSILLLSGTPALARTTPAGTVLTTSAQAVYTDITPRVVESQPLTLTVTRNASASVDLPERSATVSGARALPCVLTNASNYANSIRTTVTMSYNTFAYLVEDTNGDGMWQSNENTILRSTPTMEPDASVRCFLLVRAAPGTSEGETGAVTVFAAPTDATQNQASVRFTATYAAPKMLPAFTFAAADPMTSSPIVRNGLAVTGSEAGVLYAVRAQGDAAGALAWRYPETGSLGAPIRGRVAADATGLYFTANDGILHKIDANGQPLWQSRVVPAGTDTEAMPIVTDDAVTLACGDGRVRRIDKQTGSILAASPTVGLGTLSTPSMPRDGDLWLGGSDGRLYNMDVDHGFTVMSAHSISNQPMSATPFVDARSGVVMSVSGEGDVFAMRVRSDQIVWGPKSLGSPVKGSPWVDSNAGIAYFATTSGTLHALRVTDGAPVAGYPVQLTTTGGFVGAPVVLPLPNGQTTVFLGSTSGTFFAVNAANPGRVARFETGDPTVQFAGAPALSGPTMDDIIVVAGTNGRLYGFRVRDALAAM